MNLSTFLKSIKVSVITYLNLKFQFFGTPKIDDEIIDKQTLSYPYRRKITQPVTLDEKLHWKFEFVKEVSYPEIFVTTLKKGRIWGNEGFVIDANNILIKEVSRHYNDKVQELSIFKVGRILKPICNNATVAVASAAGAHVYYHWMIDIIPRIEVLIKTGYFNKIDYFVLDYTGLAFQKELLKKLNIDENKIICSNGFNNFHLQAEELVVPSYVSPNDAPSLEACRFLRELFEDEIISKKPERKLYLQRKKGRKIINEIELIIFLKKKGFEIIQAENYTVSQQARLFSQAEFIVSPHGAGLTNLVFCNSGTKVIDIFSPAWVNPCYWILSSHLNLNYSYLIGEGKKYPDNYDPLGKDKDIIVDIIKLNKLFNTIDRS